MFTIEPFSDAVTLDEFDVRTIPRPYPDTPPLPPAATPEPAHFGYMFPDLQKDPSALLPTSPRTVSALKELGDTMSEPGTDPALDSSIPSAYTYFGQFVDHDITLMGIPGEVDFDDPNLKPLSPDRIGRIVNHHTPGLDLDSIYDESPRAGINLMLIGRVTTGVPPRPLGKGDDFYDLPRLGPLAEIPERERVPRVGDRRNDETTIVSQLHAAFLRAHNVIVAGGYDHHAARRLLRLYYQTVVVNDFLPRVADASVLDEMLSGPWEFYDPPDSTFFMPFEFTAAAYRFGHSMVRESYDINDRFTAEFAPVLSLFNVFGRYTTLPENWMIRWGNFLDGGSNRARLIDTRLTASLSNLPGFPPRADGTLPEHRLPVLTLLRGYVLNIPTGQAVADALRLRPADRMSDADIESVAARIPGGRQLGVLRAVRTAEDGTKWKLSARTPLWFYVLAEAAYLNGGKRLGPVGSRLVAGVLVTLARRGRDSILQLPGLTAAVRPDFKLEDLMRLARVL
ncbi:MAG: hypothetical protein QOJ70_3578 [Acidobacteriota bacterium]|jgi:hypothetical protein|nr:hypothetical protein [Acidobacteriota bacterium]